MSNAVFFIQMQLTGLHQNCYFIKYYYNAADADSTMQEMSSYSLAYFSGTIGRPKASNSIILITNGKLILFLKLLYENSKKSIYSNA